MGGHTRSDLSYNQHWLAASFENPQGVYANAMGRALLPVRRTVLNKRRDIGA